MRSVLITGAGGGMGRAAAKLLSESGFFVFALDIKPAEENENTIFIKTDLRDEQSISLAFEKVHEKTDSLFAVIHFAGIYALDSLVEMDSAEYDRIFDINVRGAYLVNKIFLPLLSKGGRIVITTSELAPLDPLPFTGIYAVTKGALDKYAFALKMELQLLGIEVSVLRAGAVKTDMLGASTSALDVFCEHTKLYNCNAKRFKSIVERVEARCVSPDRVAKKVAVILRKRHPAFAYSLNRNPLLLLLGILPKRLALALIRMILKTKN